MSALSNPAPAPVQQPPQRLAPVVQEAPKKPSPWKGILITTVIIASLWGAYNYWSNQQAAKRAPAVVARLGKVEVGPFLRSLRVGGVTAARDYANITAPRLRGFESRNQMELLNLVKNGSWVKKADTLAQIDPGYLIDHVDDIKSTITESKADVEKRRAEQGVELEALLQTLRVAKAQVDKARLDASASEVRTDIERELLKLSLEESDARYKQSQLDMPQRKVIHEAEVKILGFTTERHVRHRGRHENDIKAYTVISPMEGMVVLQNVFRGGGESQQVQQGDQLGSGQPLMKIVNPKSMQVEATINQSESTQLRIGQMATIGLDAFPGLTFKGRIYSIGALAVGGWRQNYYIRSVPVRIAIEGADPRLIPDLSASADVILEQNEKATLVPIGAIHEEGNKSFVFVKTGDQFVKREVKLGASNNLYAVALSGVTGGEELKLD